jgi:hypothetical protein
VADAAKSGFSWGLGRKALASCTWLTYRGTAEIYNDPAAVEFFGNVDEAMKGMKLPVWCVMETSRIPHAKPCLSLPFGGWPHSLTFYSV